MTRREMARQNFLKGYNCSQAVVLAFSDIIPVSEDILLRLASPFGGGMGRLREVCGAVSGMFFVLGAVSGYCEPRNAEAKAALYEDVQELADEFEKANGSIVCRELLGLREKRQDPRPEERTPEYYRKRPCPELAGKAAEIMEGYLRRNGLDGGPGKKGSVFDEAEAT